jgi:hypothetical protein
MTRGRVRVLLIAGWLATGLFLIYVAGVPPWLAFVGNMVGAVVIHSYARSFADEFHDIVSRHTLVSTQNPAGAGLS